MRPVQDHGPRFVFGLTAFFPLVVSASALLIDERPVGQLPGWGWRTVGG